jgi:hypothetical protein
MRIDASFFEAELRFARWARKERPRHTAKWLRAELKISKARADRALAGDLSKDTLARALRRWGWALALEMLEPFCGPQAFAAQSARLARIEQEFKARIEQEFHDMRAEGARDANENPDMAGGLDRAADALASDSVDELAQRPGRASRRAGEKTQSAPRKGNRS